MDERGGRALAAGLGGRRRVLARCRYLGFDAGRDFEWEIVVKVNTTPDPAHGACPPLLEG
ncbi:MAG: hypothetical protein WBQ21_10600 [Solirubrobacteraceae bacterium]